MYIGEIYLPILSSIDKKSVSKITKEIAGINVTEPKSVSIRRNLQPITLEGYLYNDGEKNDAQYAEDVEALQYRSAGYCYTQYADLDGFIEIDNADAPQTSEELGVRNYSIEGKYLPATKYERVVEVETEMRENEFNIEFPPHVALPIGATNVRVKTSQDSVKLSAPAFTAGNIPIYRPFPAFYPADVTHSDSDAPQYDATAYKLTYNLLDAENENISYTIVSGVDVPLGSYRVVLRIKEDSVVTGDVKITVSDGTTNVVDSLHTLVGDGVWNIVKTASFSILQRGLTYTVTVSKATDDVSNIAINYGFLLPEKRARVAFDVAAEYDVGECKVYDTITTDAVEAGWIQVYNPEHDFTGDIVVQNSMFRWVIKQTAWKDATKVYNVTGTSPVEIGELYNKAFGDDTVAIKFKEIKPNYLKFTFELDTGNATSESTSAKEIDTVEITPFNVVIDKDVIGTYKDHYTFESTPGAMVEYENGIIAGIDSNSVYGLIKSVDVTSSIDGYIIETTDSESSDSYVVPFVIPCEITSYLYKQASDLVISKDNGDVERKFWKDDFSVVSTDQYTVSGSITGWGSGSLSLPTNGRIYRATPSEIGEYKVILSSDTLDAVSIIRLPLNTEGTLCVLLVSGVSIFTIGFYDYKTSLYIVPLTTTGVSSDTNPHSFGIDIVSKSECYLTFEGNRVGNSFSLAQYTLDSIGIRNAIVGGVVTVYELSYSPSISYSDDFTSDTVSGANGRYQAVTGTVAYDNVNKRMNVITATGANGKASGRLKSYKFTEGSQIYDVTLPTGADGDFITLVTHSANGLMTDGIGVGLQSDGAGNWNLATLSGTTVTEGADSGLDDADVARIEIEKDVTGAYWYYIYDAAGTKPTTATGKLFTTLTEGYTGWYANGAGATTQTYAIDNISIRAESIVGRTNVEVEEPFWFRDEFSENSLGRCIQTQVGKYTISGGKLTIKDWGQLLIPKALKDTTTSFTWNPAMGEISSCRLSYVLTADKIPTGAGSVETDASQGKQVLVRFNALTGVVSVQNMDVLTIVAQNTLTFDPLTLDTDHTVQIEKNGATITVTIDGVAQSCTLPSVPVNDNGFEGFGMAGAHGIHTVDDWQISGTRVYNKPIHRGAMLETYHDGTQEVVGTTFVDDCQWDRSAEYTNFGTPTWDVVKGCIVIDVSNEGVLSKHSYGAGQFKIRMSMSQTDATSTSYRHIYFTQTSLQAGDIRIMLMLTAANVLVIVPGQYSGTTWNDLQNITVGTYTNNSMVELDVIITESNLSIWKDGVFLTTLIIATNGINNFELLHAGTGNSSAIDWKIYNLQVIAASPDATNGIAACIPPIGGGARYGVEESVYNTFTTANVDKGVYLTSAKVKTTNPNADEVSLEYVNETTSTTLDNTSIVVDADYTIKTTPITIKENETDVLTVGVKNSTTCNQPATYVESLSLIPVSGNSVLYPQDLAFISGVKPSQKRKVEVK